MSSRVLRLALAITKSAGGRRALGLLAIAGVFAATFVSFVSATATEENALDWYLGTAFPDYEFTPAVLPNAPPPPVPVSAADFVNLSSMASNISAAFTAIPGVVSAGPFLLSDFDSFDRPTYGGSSLGSISFVTAAMFEIQQGGYVDHLAAGTSHLGPDEVLIPQDVARADNLALGETLPLYRSSFYQSGNCTISCTPQPSYVNVTIQGIYVPKTGPTSFDNNVFPWSYSAYVAPAILNLSELPGLVPAIVPSNSSPWQEPRYDVLIARSAVIDPFDDGQSLARLGALKARMFLVAEDFHLQVYSPLETAYWHFLQDRGYVDLAVLFAVAPLALTAASLEVTMQAAEVLIRYRDLSIARSRGIGLRRLRLILWLEGALEVCASSPLGLAAGVLAVTLSVPTAAPVLMGTYVDAFLVSLALCLGIGFATNAYALKEFSKGTIAAGLVTVREHAAPQDVSGKIALVGLGVGATLFVGSWFVTAPLMDVVQASSLFFGTSRGFLLSFSFLALLFVVCFSTPRMAGRMARWRRSHEVASDVPLLYRSALVRAGRSPDQATLFIATFVLSACILIGGLIVVQQTSVENSIYGETGSDILLTLPGSVSGGTPGASNPPIANYSAVPGVSELTFASVVPGANGIATILVNASSYSATVRTDKISYGDTLASALRGLTNPRAAVVNSAFVAATGLGAGAHFGNLTIVGVVPRMPGLQRPDQVGNPAVFTDYGSYGIEPTQTDIVWVLVRVASRADPRAVAGRLSSLDQLAVLRVAAVEVGGLNASPLFGALGSLWNVDIWSLAFLLLLALAGYYLRVRIEVARDFSRMRARGLPGRLVRRLICSSTSLTLWSSTLWGVGMGELSVILVVVTTIGVGDNPFGTLMPSLPVALIAVVYVSAGLVATLFLSRGFRRLAAAPYLRERIL